MDNNRSDLNESIRMSFLLAGICFAELAGLCPNTSGSAYMYAYITLGECVAFVIGWGLIVEYVIGTAAGAVALSDTVDALCGGWLSKNTKLVAGTLGKNVFF